MAPIKIRAVGTGAAESFRLKASEFLAGAEEALAAGRWNLAGTNATHAGISAADAVLSARAGCVSGESDHQAVIGLLQERVATFNTSARRQLAGLLRSKSSVEYSNRLVTEVEARRLVDAAQRFLEWATRAMAS
jgi:HEPN domain-containing protein